MTSGEAGGIAAFAGALVHELRTPLSVASSEVDLALARERSASSYREALTRIGERLAELIDVTSDFAFCAHLERHAQDGRTSSLDEILHALAERFGVRRGSPIQVAVPGTGVRVRGSRDVVQGALALLVEHAVRHRRTGVCVRLLTSAPRVEGRDFAVSLVLDAGPEGFVPAAWAALGLDASGADHATSRDLRLRAAVDVIRAGGGSVTHTTHPGVEAVVITLAAGPGVEAPA